MARDIMPLRGALARQPAEILLVEDAKEDVQHTLNALREANVSSRLHVVSDGVEAMAFLRREGKHVQAPHPDLVLLDLNLPKKDGRQVLDEILDNGAVPMAVVIVSGAKGERVGPYLRAGALDYVIKGDTAKLGAAVEAALAVRQPLRRLSPRQVEVLRLLAEGSPTRDIASRLKISIKTVEAHRAAVLKRLELGNVAELVRYAVLAGLVAARR